MKKYNLVIIVSIILYFSIAAIAGYKIVHINNLQNHQYRVEINRIVNQISDVQSITDIDLNQYQYIQNIIFLKVENQTKEEIEKFYASSSNYEAQIQPLYEREKLLGYLKFIYQIPVLGNVNYFLLLQSSLALLELFILLVLIHLKRKIVKPFIALNDLSLQLANGHFKGIVKEEKNHYLGHFMRSIGQLKDSLDISRKRELELLKDKKKMILSLSHDIKTPLSVIKLYGKAISENMYTNQKDKKHAIEQISEKAVEIEKYVNEIIKSSREDILDLPVKQGEFYLQDMMKKVLNNYEELCILRQIQLEIHSYENKLLKGDIDRSQEVLENILENAFKYGDGKRIDISFYEEDGCQIICIFNTGIAVTDNDLNHIFDSFFRGTNSNGQQGSGLGLYICQTLMRKMDGAIFAKKQKEGMELHVVFRQ